ncbi:MAG: hypothetical protein RLZZ511_2532 [Cyanobacteriota bacterium]|jgi:hypothetical protein
MALDQAELRDLFVRTIFEETTAEDWVQDVWGLSPMLGDSAAKLWEACEWLLADCPEATLENFMQYLYRQQLDESSSTTNY